MDKIDEIRPLNISFEPYESHAYSIGLHISGTIACVFGSLGMYFNLCKSPKAFGAYKYFLFNISFWAFCFDIYMTIFYSPKLLFPALVMCPDGLLRTKSNAMAQICFYFWLFFFGASTVAIVSAFVYRYAALVSKLNLILSWRFLAFLAFCHIAYEWPAIFLYVLAAWDRPAVETAILTQWPLIREQFLRQGCTAIHFKVSSFSTAFMIACVTGFGLGCPLVITLFVKSFRSLKDQREHMSPKTYKLHKQLLISLIFQLVIPMISLFGPMTITTIQIYNEAPGITYVSQIGFGLGTLHSTMNCIMMLVMISPYRQVVIKYFGCFKKRNQISSDRNNLSSFHQQQTEILKDTTGLSHAAYLG